MSGLKSLRTRPAGGTASKSPPPLRPIENLLPRDLILTFLQNAKQVSPILNADLEDILEVFLLCFLVCVSIGRVTRLGLLVLCV